MKKKIVGILIILLIIVSSIFLFCNKKEKTINNMTLREKIGQMLMVYYTLDEVDDDLINTLKTNQPGGFIITGDNLKEYNTDNLDMRLEKIMQEKNTISSILKIIAWVLIVLGFILGFILGKNEYDDIEFSSLMTIWLTYGGISLGILALAEIIQILHDIRFSIWDSKKKS